MKIRVEQDELKKAVGWAARTLPSRPQTQLHAGIRIEAGTDEIHLTTFDSETATRADIDAVIDEPGVVIVSGRLLADISKELPRQPVELSLDGSKLAIRCGRTHFALPTLALDQSAELPQMPEHRGEVDADKFVDAITQVHIAASKDDLLPPLTGIRVELSESHITLVATDRYRLAIREVEWRPAGFTENLSALVKARQLGDLVHSLDHSDTVRVALGDSAEGRIGFAVSGRQLITRVMHGDFPTYRALLPDSASTTVTISPEELKAAVKRMKIIVTDRNRIELKFSDGEVTLTAAGNDDASADESLECIVDGDPLSIAFNPEFLMEGLTATKADEVAMAFNGPGKAAIIRPAGDAENYRYLLMPMSLAR